MAGELTLGFQSLIAISILALEFQTGLLDDYFGGHSSKSTP